MTNELFDREKQVLQIVTEERDCVLRALSEHEQQVGLCSWQVTNPSPVADVVDGKWKWTVAWPDWPSANDGKLQPPPSPSTAKVDAAKAALDDGRFVTAFKATYAAYLAAPPVTGTLQKIDALKQLKVARSDLSNAFKERLRHRYPVPEVESVIESRLMAVGQSLHDFGELVNELAELREQAATRAKPERDDTPNEAEVEAVRKVIAELGGGTPKRAALRIAFGKRSMSIGNNKLKLVMEIINRK